MSDLRDQIAEALTREHYRRAHERIEASVEEHCAGFADAVMPIVERLTQRAEQAEAAVAEVRRLQEMTKASSCRVHAIEQAQDTLAVLDRILGPPGVPVTGDDVRDANAPQSGWTAEEGA